jgi:hypothetical protein
MQSESIEQQLHELALVAKAAFPGSRQRQQALSKIYRLLDEGGVLKRRPGTHPQVFSEVKTDILTYACEKIDNFDPEKGQFLRWINSHFWWRQRDAQKKFSQPQHKSLDDPATFGKNAEEGIWQSLNLLSVFNLGNHPDYTSAQLRDFLEDDPDGKFCAAHVKDRPDVTFQSLALRGMYGEPYREVAQRTGISISTLSSFYQRRLAEFSPYIREYFMNN